MSDPPPSARPVERLRGKHPPEGDWRAERVSRSHHSRLSDHMVEPLEDHDRARAEKVCGEICRTALVDLAPALLLLPAAERRRARALGAFALTLFDFADQPGLDGDRLAEINRWEFRLEEALDGQPVGQPVFVLMACEEAVRPWPRPALDLVLAAARRRALAAASAASKTPRKISPGLAEGLAAALLGEPVSEDAVRLARDLLGAGGGQPAGGGDKTRVRGIPKRWRAAARYLRLASARLGDATSRRKPKLGLGTRLALLARARLLP